MSDTYRIALEDAGENVLDLPDEDDRSYSLDEIDRNVRRARAYLQRHGVLVPR